MMNEVSDYEKNSRGKLLRFIIDFIICIILIAIDQFTKYLATVNLKEKPSKILISGVFQLTYLENTGAAFGMLKGKKYFFLIVAVVMLIFIGYLLIKMPLSRKYFVINVCFVLIAAGAVGNMIDRVVLNYVVDFFYFSLINFPIFNVADIYVSVSCFILIISVLFYYKESDFAFLSKKKETL